MFSASIKARIAGLALAGAVFVAPVTALAGVVVKSTGPSASKYPVGMKIDDNASVTLKTGDSITVLTSRGTKVMKGAGTFKVGEKPKATRARFSALTRKRAANRVRTGAVRTGNDGGPARNPNLWYVDVSQPGTICLYDLQAVRLWRPNTESIATYALSEAGSSDAVDVTFDVNESVAPLDPALLTVTPGTAYSITAPGDGSQSVEVTFALLAADYARADQLAEALVAEGCTAQVEQLADRLGG
ncbi:hypothetical protein [Erythrobacter sp. THAF29]|uniref:hypothetical protein n=1 Tax=Erythrobacter sp. THAF29 TaxID=2587851 RepID=UPI0012687DB2|nr:hypothetical protein [Erythrobacter sp. THAF29]QFT78682.1 hypothetical protein FIU90_14120 [Erythrobacter sp. THAF29]